MSGFSIEKGVVVNIFNANGNTGNETINKTPNSSGGKREITMPSASAIVRA